MSEIGVEAKRNRVKQGTVTAESVLQIKLDKLTCKLRGECDDWVKHGGALAQRILQF